MPQKARKKAKSIVLPIAMLLAMFVLQVALTSAASTSTYDQILKPVQAIYDLVKYAVTVIAGLVLLFAG